MNKPLLRLILISLLTLSSTAVWPQTQAVPPLSGVLGQVQSFGGPNGPDDANRVICRQN